MIARHALLLASMLSATAHAEGPLAMTVANSAEPHVGVRLDIQARLKNTSDAPAHFVCEGHPLNRDLDAGSVATGLEYPDGSGQFSDSMQVIYPPEPPVHHLAPGAVLVLAGGLAPSQPGPARLTVRVICHATTPAGSRTGLDIEYKAEKSLTVRGPRRPAR